MSLKLFEFFVAGRSFGLNIRLEVSGWVMRRGSYDAGFIASFKGTPFEDFFIIRLGGSKNINSHIRKLAHLQISTLLLL